MPGELYAVLPDGTPVRSQVRPLFPERSLYDHRFGGPARHRGAVPPGGEKPVVLLFEFDLKDPNVFVSLPNARRLPLYNAIRYDSASMAYQVVSDEEIRIVRFDEGRGWTPDFPYADFPEHLEEMSAAVQGPIRVEYDCEAEDNWTGIWWGGEEPAREPGPHDAILLDASITQEWREGGVPCENPACGHGETELIAAFHGEPFGIYHIYLWNSGEDRSPDVVIRYRLCPRCQTVHVANLVN